MSKSDASAPGKLLIAGEYAVLHGAPAIAMAVDIRARASISKPDGKNSYLIDSASGQKHAFACNDRRRFRWLGAAPMARGEILQVVLETLMAEMPGLDDFPALAIEMDTDTFYCRAGAETRKLGLGSSAAVLVALVGALVDALGLSLDDGALTEICVNAHRNFQRGQGSGVDVATALNGGVVGARLAGPGGDICVEKLSWPSGFFMVPVWSGESASTMGLLSNFSAFRQRNPGAYERRIKSLTKHAESVFEAWHANSTGRILAAIEAYEYALRSLDHEAEIGILTDEHERLRALAAQCGAHYKTSGAGGGDFGLAYTDSARVADTVTRAYEEAGFSILGISPKTPGLTVDDDERGEAISR